MTQDSAVEVKARELLASTYDDETQANVIRTASAEQLGEGFEHCIRAIVAALSPAEPSVGSIRRAVIEECARMAEKEALNKYGPTAREAICQEVASAIRSLGLGEGHQK